MTYKAEALWIYSYWILLFLWIIGALLFMNKVNAGFLNNYLADLAFPPWFYIQLRGLHRADRRLTSVPFFGTWFGQTPPRAGVSIFMVGLTSELFMLVWPNHLTTGTFDPLDIFAYAFGLIVCIVADMSQNGRQ